MAEERVSTGILLPGGARVPEIPAGYRQTEAGVIPQGWTFGRLADFGVFRSGSGFPLIYQGLQSGDYPFFKVSDMNNQGNELFMEVANHWIDEETRKKLNAIKHPIGSIAFAKIGAAIFLERKRLLSQESCIDNNMMVFSLTDHHACQHFFYYLFLRLELGKLVSTTALPSLSGRQIGAISVPIPPSDEQYAITEALSDVDDLLRALEALIAKKRAIKQAAMQQFLTGKIRLPGFNGAWETKQLRELAVLTMGQSPSSKFYNLRGSGLPLIQGNADIEDRKTIGRVWTTQASKHCDAGDLILTVRAPVGTVAIARDKACLGRGVCGLKPVGDCAFLFHALVYAEERWQILEQGSTFTATNSEQVKQFRLSVPSDENEQTAIAAVLSDMDAEIAALERRRDKTSTLKQGMMQQLLTGRTRLLTSE